MPHPAGVSVHRMIYKLALSFRKQMKKKRKTRLMQWCNRPHARTIPFYFSFYNWGSSLLACCLFTKWQARKQSSFANSVQITLTHLSSITVQTLRQTRCLRVLGRQVFFFFFLYFVKVSDCAPGATQSSFIFPLDKTSQSLMSAHTVRECTCHFLRALSVTPWGTSLTLCEALHA